MPISYDLFMSKNKAVSKWHFASPMWPTGRGFDSPCTIYFVIGINIALNDKAF